jgi:hypothetical protein
LCELPPGRALRVTRFDHLLARQLTRSARAALAIAIAPTEYDFDALTHAGFHTLTARNLA